MNIPAIARTANTMIIIGIMLVIATMVWPVIKRIHENRRAAKCTTPATAKVIDIYPMKNKDNVVVYIYPYNHNENKSDESQEDPLYTNVRRYDPNLVDIQIGSEFELKFDPNDPESTVVPEDPDIAPKNHRAGPMLTRFLQVIILVELLMLAKLI